MPNLTISPHWEGGCDRKEKSRPIGRQVGCFLCMTSPSFFIVGDSYLLAGSYYYELGMNGKAYQN